MQKFLLEVPEKEANNEVKKLNDISEDLKKNTETDIQEMTDMFIKSRRNFQFQGKRNTNSLRNYSFNHII